MVKDGIRQFFSALQLTPEDVRKSEDWEIDFYYQECWKYGISKIEMADYIFKVNKGLIKRVPKRIEVTDLETGKIYRTVRDAEEGTGLKSAAIKRDAKRFKLKRFK